MKVNGPTPTPTALKRLRGNPGGRPLPEAEPKLKSGKPMPPKWMTKSKGSISLWRELATQLAAMGVLTTADRTALAALVEAYQDWLAARKVIAAEGAYYKKTSDRGGKSIAPHPALAVRAESWKRLTAQLAQFGLSPASRTRVQVLSGNSEDEFEKFLSALH